MTDPGRHPLALPRPRRVPMSATRNAPRRLASANLSSLNTALAIMLMLVVAFAPIPLGSNRPAFWMLLATVVGLIGCWYATVLLVKQAPPRVPISRLRPEATAFLLFAAFAVLQLIPPGSWLDPSVSLPGGAKLEASRLSLTLGDSLLSLIGFGSYALFAMLVLQVSANRRRARQMLVALFVLVVANAIFALVNLHFLGDTTLGLPKSQYEGYATGTFFNRNSFATFVAIGLTVGVALLFDQVSVQREGRDTSRWLTILLLCLGMVFIAAALLSSGSRMGAAAAAVGVAAMSLLALASAGRSRGRVLIVTLVILAVLAVTFLAFGTGTLDRFAEGDIEDDSRWELFSQIQAAIALRPWTGYGGGSFITAFPAFQHPPLSGAILWNKAHNTYLALWFEYGVVFGSIPPLIVASLFARAVPGAFSQSSSPLALAAVGSVVVVAVHSLVDFSLEIQGNVYLFLAILALGSAHMRPLNDAAVRT